MRCSCGSNEILVEYTDFGRHKSVWCASCNKEEHYNCIMQLDHVSWLKEKKKEKNTGEGTGRCS